MSGQEHHIGSHGVSPVVGRPLDAEASAQEAFVVLAYSAAFWRTPSPVEIEGQVTNLSGGVSYTEFLANLLASPERQALDRARRADQASTGSNDSHDADFIAGAYRAVMEREVDESGRDTGAAYFADGGTYAGFLERLRQSEELQLLRSNRDSDLRRQVYQAMEPERFVRLAFEAVLNREADEGAVKFYIAELEERMKPGDFLGALSRSPEGQNVKRQQGLAPVLATCGALTALLEDMLRKLGVVLNFGPIPAFDAPAHVLETTMRNLTATIEMLSSRQTV